MKVKVRVAVAVDVDGKWNASGWNGADDKDKMDLAVEVVEPGEKRYWLEAELEIPTREEITVQARVSDDIN